MATFAQLLTQQSKAKKPSPATTTRRVETSLTPLVPPDVAQVVPGVTQVVPGVTQVVPGVTQVVPGVTLEDIQTPNHLVCANMINTHYRLAQTILSLYPH